MSEREKKYLIDGIDDDEILKPKQENKRYKYQEKAKPKRYGRTVLHESTDPNENTYRGVLIFYSGVQLIRAKCPACGEVDFVSRSFRFNCCGVLYQHVPFLTKREVQAEYKRKLPSIKTRNNILLKQNQCCLYCNKEFDSMWNINNKLEIIKIQWDHLVPYSYSGSCADSEFVATCQFCNAWKSSLIFRSIEAVKAYVKDKWKQCDVVEPLTP